MNDIGADDIEMCTRASYLYSGGWRSKDREWIKESFHMSDEETDAICTWLKVIEEDEGA